MRHFSVPYNNDRLFFSKFENKLQYVNFFKELYFSIPNKWTGSGRSIPQAEDYEAEIVEITHEAKSKNIECNMLLNVGCLGLKLSDKNFIKDILNYLSSLVEKANIDVITVADYFLAKELKKAFSTIKLECSSIAYINSLTKAEYWVNIGCDILVIPTVLNKDLKLIQEFRKEFPDLILKLVTNQKCLYDCPMWISHHNIRSHGNEGCIYEELCHKDFADNPWKYISSSYIPPEYIHFYDKYIDIYKLVDRKFTTENIIKQFDIYSNIPNPKNKLSIEQVSITEEQFKNVLYCNKKCSDCNMCKDIQYL